MTSGSMLRPTRISEASSINGVHKAGQQRIGANKGKPVIASTHRGPGVTSAWPKGLFGARWRTNPPVLSVVAFSVGVESHTPSGRPSSVPSRHTVHCSSRPIFTAVPTSPEALSGGRGGGDGGGGGGGGDGGEGGGEGGSFTCNEPTRV